MEEVDVPDIVYEEEYDPEEDDHDVVRRHLRVKPEPSFLLCVVLVVRAAALSC